MKKNILLTFDYELFQGKKSGSVESCMLKPTGEILSILQRQQAKAVFFVDMMYLCRLSEAAKEYPLAKCDFELIKNQLIHIAENGHYIFNHLHPHWLDARYDSTTNEWQLLDDSKYAFASLTERDQALVFDQTMDLLNHILSACKTSFQPNGYRAGGLYIQPFAIFQKYFERHNIVFDFSVLAGGYGQLQHGDTRFDFSDVSKSIYHFQEEIIQEDRNGKYTEFTLSFVQIPFFYRVLNSLYFRLFMKGRKYHRFGNGISTHNSITNLAKNRWSSTETFSVEMLNRIKIPLYLAEATRKKYLHLLSHPKLVSAYNLEMFEKLLVELHDSGTCEFDFKNFEWQ